MSDVVQFNQPEMKPKSFWKRPEGLTGIIFLAAIGVGAYFLITKLPWEVIFANTLYLAATLAVGGAILYMVLDPKVRNLVWYMYKSVMRSLTSWFVQIDPIGVLKSYIEDLEGNLGNMRKQIGILRGQMRKIQTLLEDNHKEIDQNMKLASAAKVKGQDQQLMLASRKAARLKESNAKYEVLLQKMEILYRILTKMHSNSEILLEDTRSQVQLKEQERKAIRTSHSAMRSAMSVISGDPDKRAMFDMAMESIADDVANKVGEMERFMEASSNFLSSVDLQQGVFQEEGLKMLEKWEKESTLMLMDKTANPLPEANQIKGIEQPAASKGSVDKKSSYDNLFN
jgi:predicted  nucleic acid-binding Zn-ribbon protein